MSHAVRSWINYGRRHRHKRAPVVALQVHRIKKVGRRIRYILNSRLASALLDTLEAGPRFYLPNESHPRVV